MTPRRADTPLPFQRTVMTLFVGVGWLVLAALRNLFLAFDEAGYRRRQGDLYAAAGWLGHAAVAYAGADQAAGDLPSGGPVDLESCCLAGRCCQLEGDLAAAANLYRRALRREPGNHVLHRMLGETLLAHRSFGAALFHVERALWRDRGDADLRLSAAWAATVLGQVERACDHLARVAEDHPETRAGDLARARLGLLRRDPAGALRSALRAAAHAPKDVEVRLALAEACGMAGRVDDARRHYRKLLETHPDLAEARVGLAEALLPSDPSGALAVVEEGLKIQPRDASLLCAKGETLLRLGDVSAAVRWLQRSAEAEPDRARARAKLQEARRLQEDALERCSGHGS
jgi:tetratricopeptide (TPR) repeat protein